MQSDLGALIDHFRTNFKGATLGTPFMDGGEYTLFTEHSFIVHSIYTYTHTYFKTCTLSCRVSVNITARLTARMIRFPWNGWDPFPLATGMIYFPLATDATSVSPWQRMLHRRQPYQHALIMRLKLDADVCDTFDDVISIRRDASVLG